MSDVRVIIVDDQETYRSAARLVVSLTEGFEVVGEADSGESAVDIVSEVEADLVLMDINMEGMDGLEATRLIREKDGPQVLVLSTYEAEEFADRARAAGAIGFISKADFDPFTLANAWQGR